MGAGGSLKVTLAEATASRNAPPFGVRLERHAGATEELVIAREPIDEVYAERCANRSCFRETRSEV